MGSIQEGAAIMTPKSKPPVRLVVEKAITYGYRGYPSLYIGLECGHNEFFDRYTRAEKFQAGKTKIKCWQCWRKDNPLKGVTT